MPTVIHSVSVPATADVVWELMRDFERIDRWMPGIDRTALQGNPAGTAGSERVLTVGDQHFVERLVSRDDAAMRLTYTLPEPGYPISQHLAQLTVTAEDEGSCNVTWQADFRASDDAVSEVDEAMGTAFQYGLRALAARFAAAAPDARPAWERYPAAAMDEDNCAMYEGWLERELRLPKCAQCGAWHAPSRPMCPFCWSFASVPTAVSGRGTVALVTVLHQGPELEGVSYPYPVVTVELEEQPSLRFTSTIRTADPEHVLIGTPVELQWTERGGAPFPVFAALPTATEGEAA